jgi:hypothetical protein
MRKRWRSRTAKKEASFLGHHMIPVVLGPKQWHYIIDHHHLCRALHEEGQTEVLVSIVAELGALGQDQFWSVLDHRGWMYPFNKKGRRRPYSDIPKSVADLVDDPYRSLAGEIRRAGGFAKDTTPFSEFLWANFLRDRIAAKAVKTQFDQSLKKALQLAKSKEADYLPGWCGPVAHD